MIVFLSLLGCRNEVKGVEPAVEPSTETIDLDGDGFLSDEDCDDSDAQTYPGASEICDGIDNSCDGLVDEGVTNTFYADSDQDGFGNEEDSIEACEEPSGYVTTGGDCDDTDDQIYPAAPEICDGIDNNCEGTPDEGMGVFYFADNDRDGFGDSENLIESCVLSEGMSAIDGDCDDTNASVNPLAQEFCDGADNDCDGDVDEEVLLTFYFDGDEDGFGSTSEIQEACIAPEGYIAQGGDCNDVDTLINPNAIEVCDGQDNDCDGSADEEDSIDGLVWYQDTDGDGFGNAAQTLSACTIPAGYVADDTDCNDSNNSVYPQAVEFCNGVDDNCDGSTDEIGASGGVTIYVDNDGDGYGDGNNATSACSLEIGYSSTADDCDDNNNAVNPAAVEICNNLDDNCDGVTDSDAPGATLWYEDTDGDGYGTQNSITQCAQPSGYAADNGDCNDSDSAIHPNASELCDGVDSDCDGLSDDEDASDRVAFFLDYDGDGYGNASFSTMLCEATTLYVSNDDDCNDLYDTINPAQDEICDGFDNDCDGLTDDQDTLILNPTEWYADSDGDGYGSDALVLEACTQPSSYIDINGDCDDADASINPDANDVPYDGVDQDCDGQSDYDADGDGFDSFLENGGGDCNDFDSSSTGCGDSQTSAAASCAVLYESNNSLPDGVYWLDPDENGDTSDAFLGYCDMTRDGGGWTLVMQNNLSISHTGSVTYTQAIQNNNLRGGTLTQSSSLDDFDVLVGLRHWNSLGTQARIEVGNTAGTPVYHSLYTISLDENDGYRLNLSGGTLSGTTVQPGLATYHSGYRFTTTDTDQDVYSSNCANNYGSPWWYGACWVGSFWGHNTSDGAYWTGSSNNGIYEFAWGAIWIRE